MTGLLNRYQMGLMLAVLAALFAVVFWPVITVLHQRWMNPAEPYGYSYMVLIIVAYLCGRESKYIDFKMPSARWPGFFVAGFCTLLLSLSLLIQVQIVSQILLPIIFWGWIAAAIGWRQSKLLVRPLLMSYFVIPIWGVVGYPLRVMSVAVVGLGLSLLHIPAYIGGFKIYLPAGVIEVAGGCSGQNYLIAGLVVSSLYALTSPRGNVRWISLVIGAFLFTAANWVRIFLLVLIGYKTDLKDPLMHNHTVFGWIIFGVFLIIFLLIMRRVESALMLEDEEMLPEDHPPIIVPKKNILSGILAVAISSVFMLYVSGVHVRADREMQTIRAPSVGHMTSVENPGWLPDFQGYNAAYQWVGDSEGKKVSLTILLYGKQSQGKELINSENQIFSQEKNSELMTYGDKAQLCNWVKLKTGDQEKNVFYVYRVGGKYTHSMLAAKLLQLYSLFEEKFGSSLVAFSFQCDKKCSSSELSAQYKYFWHVLNGVKFF